MKQLTYVLHSLVPWYNYISVSSLTTFEISKQWVTDTVPPSAW